jgi:glycerol-3-phosphate dehydrogenase
VSKIDRDPRSAASSDYDAIVVGGGVHGCMALLQGALAGHRLLLLERDDFGGATSFNSLRIIHGGLRYLQTLDLPRFFESVGERRWLLRTYPDLIKPLPCLMPLYNEGLKRGSVMRVALALNDLLSAHRNAGVRADRRLPRGRLIPPDGVRALCPFVRPDNLAGGAVWHDACAPDSHRVIMETLRWAAACGGVALNYMEAGELELDGDRVCAVQACDRIGGRMHRFRSSVVINAAGPWCDEVLRSFGQAESVADFSIAWNILFDRAAPSDHAVALTPPGPGAQTYFMHPWKGRQLIGTGHRAWSGDAAGAKPADAFLDEFIADVNAAAPGLKLARSDILHVFSGLLPAAGPQSTELTNRPGIVDHGAQGGPKGLFSMVGIKFTTARKTALQMLQRCGLKTKRQHQAPAPPSGAAERCKTPVLADGKLTPGELELVDSLTASESVCYLEDLVYRRLGLGHDPAAASRAIDLLCENLNSGPALRRLDAV